MNDISHRDFLINYEKGISSENQVRLWLKSILIHEDITELILFDVKKTPLVSADKKEYIIEKERIEAFNKCIETKDAAMSDFFIEADKNTIRIAVFIPVFKSSINKDEISKVLMMDFDVEKGLQKFLKDWPLSTESSEAFLIRDDGSDVLFLTDVKGRTNSALHFKLSKSDSSIIAVKAINGLRGIYRGYDYTRNDVHAYIDEIPGTSWILITKTNTDEIRKDSMTASVYIILITFVIVVLSF